MNTTSILWICAIFLFAYGFYGAISLVRFRNFTSKKLFDLFPIWPDRLSTTEAPRAELGWSSTQSVETPSPKHKSASEPEFHSLRTSCVEIQDGRWQLRVRALLLNNVEREIVFDDLHTIIYTRLAPTPPLLTISYHGNAIILQDNTLFKEEKVYSIQPGDGIEIDVLIQISRYEGAPTYYAMREEGGPICVLFGLIADFYQPTNIRESKRAIPSDALFMFICRSKDAVPELIEITHGSANSVSWPPKGYELDPLVVTLDKHLSFRPARR